MRSFKDFQYGTRDHFTWKLSDLQLHGLSEGLFGLFGSKKVPGEMGDETHSDAARSPYSKSELRSQLAHHDSLRKESIHAVDRYKLNSIVFFNHGLRSGSPGSLHSTNRVIGHMDEATGHESGQAVHLYRGFNGFNLEHAHEFTDHGYTSVTHDPNEAMKFNDHPDMSLAKIHVPVGTRGLHVDHPGIKVPYVNRGEGETILQRGTRFKVLGRSRISLRGGKFGDTTHNLFHLSVVGQEKRPI